MNALSYSSEKVAAMEVIWKMYVNLQVKGVIIRGGGGGVICFAVLGK